MTLRLIGVSILAVLALAAADWPQYRGPQGMGIAEGDSLPAHFGIDENLLWKTDLPPGHSSPVFSEKMIFVTAFEGDSLLTIGLERESGKISWKQESPRPRRESFQPTHGPASPSPVTDGENVYVFFGDFGLLSYDSAGNERWKHPLGPFINGNGHGSSPILVGEKLILVVDQASDSYLLAVNTKDGSVAWKTDRPEVTRGYGTAGIFQPENGKPQVVVPGAYRVVSYDLETGEKVWWVNDFAWQLKCVPIIDGNTIYINGWEIGGDAGQQKETESFAEVLAKNDADGDGKISKSESPDQRLARSSSWAEHDLDLDGLLDERDWYFYAARRAPINNLVAIRPGNLKGDISQNGVVWRYTKSLPNTPSPLLYKGVLYLVKDGGIFSSIDPESGSSKRVARLTDAIDKYWASPVAGDGKIFTVSESCVISVIAPGVNWEVVTTSSVDDICFATPALVDGRFYLRTMSALHAFGSK